MNSAQRWKRQEREIAQILGGERMPNIGKSQADVIAGPLAVQVKTRKQLPQWLWDAIEQARRDARNMQVPVVVLSEVSKGKKAQRLVVLDIDDFASLVLWSMTREQ